MMAGRFNYNDEQWYPDEVEEHSGIFCSECGEEIPCGNDYWKILDVVLCEECLYECKHEAFEGEGC